MHKKMLALSALCRRKADPPAARRAIGRAQCNDAYWHGVFGGLYLPHLREAIWRNLAIAEQELRHDEELSWEVLDFDGDGHQEIWIHSNQFSAVVSPRRGGALEEYTVFAKGLNFASALTRRREAYHDLALQRAAELASGDELGSQSIHDIEEGIRLDTRPPLDADDRALFVERIVSDSMSLEEYARGDYHPLVSWARSACEFTVSRADGAVEVDCHAEEPLRLAKRLRFGEDGQLSVRYAWVPDVGDQAARFTTELSLFGPLEIDSSPEAETWRFSIDTIAKSERGLDRTRQGESVTLRWPVTLGEAEVNLLLAPSTATAS
jgi:alpha-amylase